MTRRAATGRYRFIEARIRDRLPEGHYRTFGEIRVSPRISERVRAEHQQQMRSRAVVGAGRVDSGSSTAASRFTMRTGEDLFDFANFGRLRLDPNWRPPRTTDAMSLMGKKKKKGKKGIPDRRGQVVEAPLAFRRRIVNHAGQMVRLSSDGVIVNQERPLPYFALVLKVANEARERTNTDRAQEKIGKMLRIVTENMTYRDLLRFALYVSCGDRAGMDAFAQMDPTNPSFMREVDRHLDRLFGDLSFLPTEHEIWTDLVILWDRYVENPSYVNTEMLLQVLPTYDRYMGDRIEYFEDSVAYGPLRITSADYLSLLNTSITNMTERLAKDARTGFRKGREEARIYLPMNRRAASFLERTDVDLRLKEMLATAYYLGGGEEVNDFFRGETFFESPTDGVRIAVEDVYERHVASKIQGKVRLADVDATGEIENLAMEDLVLISRGGVLNELLEMSERPIPHISYSMFKRFGMALTTSLHSFRMMTEQMRRTGSIEAEVVRRDWDQTDFLFRLLSDQSYDLDVRAMVLDLMKQVARRDLTVLGKIYAVVESNQRDRGKLRRAVRDLYVEHIPYAVSLFKILESKKDDIGNAETRAGEIVRNLDKGSDDLDRSWRAVLRNIPIVQRNKFVRDMRAAIALVVDNRAVYTRWIDALAGLHQNSPDRRWLFDYDPASDPERVTYLRRLQDIATPAAGPTALVVGAGESLRSVASIDMRLIVEFANSSAGSFLLPHELDGLMLLTNRAYREVVGIDRHFNGSALPQFVEFKRNLFMDNNFERALGGLSVILSGDYGCTYVPGARRLVRETLDQGDTAPFFSLLSLGEEVTANRRQFGNPLPALNVLTSSSDLLGSGRVSGDVVGVALRRYLQRDGAVRQGAYAEMVSINHLAEGEMCEVVILSTDPYGEKVQPDLLIHSPSMSRFVEVKSRVWQPGLPGSVNAVERTLSEAVRQINGKLARMMPGSADGRIMVYVVLHDAEPTTQASYLDHIGDYVGKASGEFRDISQIDVLFVRGFVGEWAILNHYSGAPDEYRQQSVSIAEGSGEK